MPTKTISALLAFPMLAALACAPAAAQDQPEFDARVEEQLGVKLPLPDRPVLAEGRLVWKDYQLADLCREFGGDFSKLPGKAIYLCRHETFAAMSTASIQAGEQ
jgi:hypothetical protein